MTTSLENLQCELQFPAYLLDCLVFLFHFFLGKFKNLHKLNLFSKQGSREDMRKTHMTRQFFEAIGPHGHFFEKTKTHF